MRWVDLREEFGAIIERLRHVWIERLPWRECFKRYDSASTFFYVDPPYRCHGSKAYLHRFEDADHEALAAALLWAHGKWLLSYNNDPWIRALYARRRGVRIETVDVPYSIARIGRTRGSELLISNY